MDFLARIYILLVPSWYRVAYKWRGVNESANNADYVAV